MFRGLSDKAFFSDIFYEKKKKMKINIVALLTIDTVQY